MRSTLRVNLYILEIDRPWGASVECFSPPLPPPQPHCSCDPSMFRFQMEPFWNGVLTSHVTHKETSPNPKQRLTCSFGKEKICSRPDSNLRCCWKQKQTFPADSQCHSYWQGHLVASWCKLAASSCVRRCPSVLEISPERESRHTHPCCYDRNLTGTD